MGFLARLVDRTNGTAPLARPRAIPTIGAVPGDRGTGTSTTRAGTPTAEPGGRSPHRPSGRTPPAPGSAEAAQTAPAPLLSSDGDLGLEADAEAQTDPRPTDPTRPGRTTTRTDGPRRADDVNSRPTGPLDGPGASQGDSGPGPKAGPTDSGASPHAGGPPSLPRPGTERRAAAAWSPAATPTAHRRHAVPGDPLLPGERAAASALERIVPLLPPAGRDDDPPEPPITSPAEALATTPTASAPPDVHVTIGRIEVVGPPTPARSTSAPEPALSLSDYLDRRAGS